MRKFTCATMNKIIDAQDILAEAHDCWARFFQGRSDEEIERIKETLRVAFPAPAPPAPDAARTKRTSK
jgi:hypothetical protein